MAEYIAIKGSTVQSLASDPSNPLEGQVWYNTTSNVLKGRGAIPTGAWSSGGNMTTARYNLCGAGASNTAALVFAGYETPPAVYYALTESYNGTSWTEVADLTRANGRGNSMGFGSQTSAIIAGGNPPSTTALTESWNGTSWTEVNDLTTGRDTMKGGGTSAAGGITFGGGIGTPPSANFYLKLTEVWNGTSWSEVGDLNIGRQQMGSATAGSSTANLCIAGELDVPYSPRTGAYVESWNGTAWTEVVNVNTGRTNMASAGIQTDALIFGGNPGTPLNTEAYNGTSWTEVADIATSRFAMAGSGTGANAIMMGGNTGGSSQSNLTEEWNLPAGTETVTFTVS